MLAESLSLSVRLPPGRYVPFRGRFVLRRGTVYGRRYHGSHGRPPRCSRHHRRPGRGGRRSLGRPVAFGRRLYGPVSLPRRSSSFRQAARCSSLACPCWWHATAYYVRGPPYVHHGGRHAKSLTLLRTGSALFGVPAPLDVMRACPSSDGVLAARIRVACMGRCHRNRCGSSS